MSTYGHFRETTPNIDALMGTGTVIEHASAMSSWTLASMSMLMTGEIKARADVAVLKDHVHLAEGFSRAGFQTAGIVANPIVNAKLHYHRGLDYFDVEPRQSMDQTAQQVVSKGLDWLDSREDSEKPFFLWLHPADPHFPFKPQDGTVFPEADEEAARVAAAGSLKWGQETFPDAKDPIPAPEALDEPTWGEISHQRNLYDSEIRQFDDAMGNLVAELKKRGLFENTVIAITSDHGEGLWDRIKLPDEKDTKHAFFSALYRKHGVMLHEEQTHIPLLFHGPGVPKGERVEQWVQHVDVAPTLYALANVPLPKKLPGKALFEEEGSDDRGPLITVCSRSFSVTLDERWRGHFPRSYRLKKMDLPVELYDLETDPGERTIIDNPEMIEEMSEILAEWRDRYSPNDPTQKLDAEVWAGLQALGYGGEIEVDALPVNKPAQK
jgi:arylsulfatase A-like enzyme